MTKQLPSFDIESEYAGPVAGIDEAGRGPLAGPVVAAAVVLDRKNVPAGLADSKTIAEKKRGDIAMHIRQTSTVGVGIASVDEIDEINILQATMLAMTRAANDLLEQSVKKPAMFLIDGNRVPDAIGPACAVVKGDALSLSIAAASIIAKTTRDGLMRELAIVYPDYGWAKNKGYGAQMHIEAIKMHGPTPHHRKTFAPIRQMLEAKN